MKYKVTYQENRKIKTKRFIVQSEDEILEKVDNIIKIQNRSFDKKYFSSSITKQEVVQLFSQISLMLDSGLNLIQVIEIIQNKNNKQKIEQILLTIKESVVKSLPIEQLLQPYKKILGNTPIVFLKLGIENGNIKESMNSLVELLQEEITTKKNLFQAIRYPLLLVISLCIALGMVFIYVLPNFEFIFQNLETIPLATELLLFFKKGISEYYLVTMIGVVVVTTLFITLYRKYPLFFEKILLEKLFFVSGIIRNYQLYKLFLAIGIIVREKYQFQVAIENSKVIIENRYLQKTITKIIEDIKKGSSIVEAFSRYKLFDEVTIKLLTTAQNTSKYETVLHDIANYHKVNFENSIKNFESYFEPIMILVIAMIVLWLVLAIMVPIWDMGSMSI